MYVLEGFEGYFRSEKATQMDRSAAKTSTCSSLSDAHDVFVVAPVGVADVEVGSCRKSEGNPTFDFFSKTVEESVHFQGPTDRVLS